MTALADPGTAVRPACSTNPEAFWPVARTADHLTAAALTAHTYCGPCPVRAACRALGADEPAGIWGGVLHIDDGRNTAIDLLATAPTSAPTRKVTRS